MLNKISYIGIAGILVGVVMLFSISDLPDLSAMFPNAVAWALIAIGAVEVVRHYIVGRRADKELPEAAEDDAVEGASGQVKPVLIFLVATIAYVALIPVIGFYVVTIVFLVGLMVALGIRKLWVFLGVPVALTAIIYLTFTLQLNVPLPEGILL